MTAWPGRVAQAPRAGRSRTPWSCSPHWILCRDAPRFGDQLGLDDEAKSQIADGSDLGTCRPQVTSVGDLPASSVSAPQLIPGTLGSAPHPPYPCSLTPCDILLRLRQWEPDCVRSPSAGRHLRLRRPGLIAAATKSMDAFDLVSKERVNTLRPACRSCRQSSSCRAPSTRSGYWDLGPPAAAGGRPGSMYRLRGTCESTPEPLRHRRPCVPCRRRPSTLLKASPVEKGAAGTLGRSWRRSSTRLLDRGTRWWR